MKNLLVILVLCFLYKSNDVFGQQLLLSENFESGVFNPLITMQTVGTFDSLPGIKNDTNFGSTKAFGFGVSTCPSNCFSNFATSLFINFPAPTLIDSLKWSEMELFDNWGSGGFIYLDGVQLLTYEIGNLPANDHTPDLTPRYNKISINQQVQQIEFRIQDITNLSGINIDDITVTYLCNLSVALQPVNQSLIIGGTAYFIVGSSDSTATYQWQTDNGLGFQNLNNAGQYSGFNNDTLTVSNVSNSNNNQFFRCIIASDSCSDTSNAAILNVTTGINEINYFEGFTLFPNPSADKITIALKNTESFEFLIYDIAGRKLLDQKFTSYLSLNTKQFAKGVYHYELRSKTGATMNGKFVKD